MSLDTCGGAGSWPTAWPACKTRRDLVGRDVFPPEDRTRVLSIASSLPEDAGLSSTRWSLDDIAFAIVNEAHAEAMHRSTIWRILEQADLKPHRSVYWLNSHDPDFAHKAREICQLYPNAPQFYEQGRLVLSCDEKTGMQMLQRKYPTQPARPGHPEKRENDYIRQGTRALIASFNVPTGEVVYDLGTTRTSQDFAAHIDQVAKHDRAFRQFDWIVDNLNTHWSLDVCRVIAKLCEVPCVEKDLENGTQRRAFLTDPTHRHVFHFTPIHGSWLNQVELFFSVWQRRFLKRGDFQSAADFERRLHEFLAQYNGHHAHPYRWTYTGEPLVRATPFAQTRRQQTQGRAWFGTKPKRFQRCLYAPRPYKRKKAVAP